MSTVLVVSFDQKAIEKLRELCESLNYRFRSVSVLDTAREWIAMQAFDVLLVDGRYSDGVSLTLLEEGWEKYPLQVGGLFNLDGTVDDQWTARLAGARIFNGDIGFDQLRKLLERLPDRFEAVTEYGVLLVEDLDSPRDIICSYIESLGYSNVRGVRSMEEALGVLHPNPNAYFAVVTDINMPRHSGIELIRTIRLDEQLAHLPIVVLTAYATAENLIDCVRAGATGFLVKPPRKKLLKAELDKCKRIFVNRMPPRICRAEDAHLLEEALDLTAR